jgi:hypothetical protein
MIYEEELIFKINRKTFASLLFIAILFFGTLSFLLQWENKRDLLTTISVHILATLIVAFFIATILLYKKSMENKEQIKILGPGNIIDHEFDISKLNTDFWYFSGGTGTETRKVTLPSIGMKSKNENNVRQVKILLLNPANQELCKNYCLYRLRHTMTEDWTERKVQLKIYATLLSCIYWEKNSPLDIEVFFKNTFSTMQYDISEDRLIISKSDPREPAFLITKPNIFYNCVFKEFLFMTAQAHRVDIMLTDYSFKELNSDDCGFSKEVLTEQFKLMGIKEVFTDKEFDYILQNAKPDFRKCKCINVAA